MMMALSKVAPRWLIVFLSLIVGHAQICETLPASLHCAHGWPSASPEKRNCARLTLGELNAAAERLTPLRGGASNCTDSASTLRSDVHTFAKKRAKELPQAYYVAHGGSTYSVLWNTDEWNRHMSAWRYLRHVVSWPISSTARAIVPIVGTFTAWAALVCFSDKVLGVPLTMAMAPLTLVSSALALLLTLRTNASLQRLTEARAAWGASVLYSRIFAGVLTTRVFPVNPSAAFLAARLVSTVGWSLRASTLGKGTDLEALNALLPSTEVAWIAAQRKPALATLDRIGHILRTLAKDPAYSALPLAAESHRILLEQISNLDGVVGICERILSSPVPPTYTLLTSRVLVLWLACVPLALRGMQLGAITVILGTFFTAYIMIGIDEIAIEIEEPMRLLPTNQICNALMLDVASRLAPDPAMPPVKIGSFSHAEEVEEN